MDVRGIHSTSSLKELSKVLSTDSMKQGASSQNIEKLASLNQEALVIVKQDGETKVLPAKESLEKQAEELNQALEPHKSFKFQVHEELERVFVQVVNRDTEEVIKEIPPEEFLDMVAEMLKYMGLIVDKRV
ncbi:flagellar protein FlaG [Halalkalibacterium ligniniphilum]|uniref:flagellar protein FlaG n=1 Tax=Halalkalibacterium ligniniphilum TaxID=1134413 RepID=UPI00034A22B3|nr:flagellar protein FlaG [Halalkalibacterium ligniniphilum]